MDGSIVTEFEMKNDTGMVTLKKLNLGDTLKYRNRTTVTFIKFKNGSRLNFHTKIIEDLTAKGRNTVINSIQYTKIPAGFTGLILYFTLDKKYLNGYHYTNGRIDRTVALTQPANVQTNANKTSLIIDDESCLYFSIYSTDCQFTYWTNPDGSLGYLDNGCTEDVIGTVSICVSGGDDNGGGVVGDPGSQGGGSGSMIGDTILVQPPFAVTFCSGLTNAEQTSIIMTIDAFETEDCPSKYLANFFTGKSFTFCVNSSVQANVIYNPVDNSFTFSTDQAASPIFAFLLEHEFFHAFQNATYSGGIAAYGKNPATGVASPGFVNIEFEQAVFNDIANGSKHAFDNGTSAQQTAYADWINGLTANGTVYPQLTPSSTNYPQFITYYNQFLNEYNALPNNVNSSPVINLMPQALINLFNNTNPNCQ